MSCCWGCSGPGGCGSVVGKAGEFLPARWVHDCNRSPIIVPEQELADNGLIIAEPGTSNERFNDQLDDADSPSQSSTVRRERSLTPQGLLQTLDPMLEGRPSASTEVVRRASQDAMPGSMLVGRGSSSMDVGIRGSTQVMEVGSDVSLTGNDDKDRPLGRMDWLKMPTNMTDLSTRTKISDKGFETSGSADAMTTNTTSTTHLGSALTTPNQNALAVQSSFVGSYCKRSRSSLTSFRSPRRNSVITLASRTSLADCASGTFQDEHTRINNLDYQALKTEFKDSDLEGQWRRYYRDLGIESGSWVIFIVFSFYTPLRAYSIIREFTGACRMDTSIEVVVAASLELIFFSMVNVAFMIYRKRILYYACIFYLFSLCLIFPVLPTAMACDAVFNQAQCLGDQQGYVFAATLDCSPQGVLPMTLNIMLVIAAPSILPTLKDVFWLAFYLVAFVAVTILYRSIHRPYYDWEDCTVSFFLLACSVSLAARKKFEMQSSERKCFLLAHTRLQVTKRVHSLLTNLVPAHIVDTMLADPDQTIAESLAGVSVLFIVIVDFDQYAHRLSPAELLTFLNAVFTHFDKVCVRSKVTKIETIGEEYVAAVGVEPFEGKSSARQWLAHLLAMALDLFGAESKLNLKLRMGLHTGPVVAGVIGQKLPRFRLFGDTINTAARMMQKGVDSELQFGDATNDILPEWAQVVPRGSIELKGKGEVNVYLLDRTKTNIPDATKHCIWGKGPRSKSGTPLDLSITNLSRPSALMKLANNLSRHVDKQAPLFGWTASLQAVRSWDLKSKWKLVHSVSSYMKNAYSEFTGDKTFSAQEYQDWLRHFTSDRSWRKLQLRGYVLAFLMVLVTVFDAGIAEYWNLFAEPHHRYDVPRLAMLIAPRVVLVIGFLLWGTFGHQWAWKRTHLAENIQMVVVSCIIPVMTVSYDALMVDYTAPSTINAALLKAEVESKSHRISIWTFELMIVFCVLVTSLNMRFIHALTVITTSLIAMVISQAIAYKYFNQAQAAGLCIISFFGVDAARKDELESKSQYKLAQSIELTNVRISTLLNMLMPPLVVQEMTASVAQGPTSHRYDRATIVQSDLVGFTKLASTRPAHEVVQIVGELFGLFDDITDELGVCKVETVGDAYIAGVAEKPLTMDCRPLSVVTFGVELVEATRRWSSRQDEHVDLRVGVHTGSCTGGIVGTKMQRYHLFGHIMSEVGMLESTAPAGSVHLSRACWEAVQQQIVEDNLPKDIITCQERQEPHLMTSKGDVVEYSEVGGGPTMLVELCDFDLYTRFLADMDRSGGSVGDSVFEVYTSGGSARML